MKLNTIDNVKIINLKVINDSNANLYVAENSSDYFIVKEFSL